MASPNITEALTHTLRGYSKEIADSVTDNNAFLTWMSKSDAMQTEDGGDTIDQQLMYSQNTNGGSYSGFDSLPMGAQQVFSAATYGRKSYAVPFMMSGDEEAANSGPYKIFDIWKGRKDNAIATMANLLSEGIASDGTGNGGKDITGLQAAIPADPTTGTYGGINAATWTFWRSQLVDTAATISTTTLTQAMNDLWALCVRGIEHPHLILAGSSFFSIYEATLMAQQRFTTEAKAKYGFTSLMYKQADVVLDNDYMSAYRAYFINTNGMKWRPHRNWNMVPGEPRASLNQDAKGTFMLWKGNLTTSVRRNQGLLIGD